MTLEVFSGTQLERAIDAVMPTIPAEHTHAIVMTADNEGVKVAAIFKDLTGVWSAEGYAEHQWDGTNVVGGKLLLSW